MKQDAILIYDYEVTGPDPSVDTPCQIAATLHIKGKNPIVVMNCLCNPGQPIAEGASEVHGLYDKDVKNSPHHTITTFMLGQYVEALDDTYNLIIGGANHENYDNTIAEKYGWEEVRNYPQVDLLTLARRQWPRLQNHKLSTLYYEVLGKPLSGAHDALIDVLGVGEVLEKFMENNSWNYRKLAEYLDKPMAWEVMAIGKYKGKFIREVPSRWVKFMCTKTNICQENKDFNLTVKEHFGYLWEAHVGE